MNIYHMYIYIYIYIYMCTGGGGRLRPWPYAGSRMTVIVEYSILCYGIVWHRMV